MEFIGKDENNVWRNGEFQERYGNSKKKIKSKGIPRTEKYNTWNKLIEH